MDAKFVVFCTIVSLVFGTVACRDLQLSLHAAHVYQNGTGRVLLHYHDKAFTLSVENWGNHIARIVCRSLQLPSSGAEAIEYEAATEHVVWDKSFYCKGKESHLSDCIQEEIDVKEYKRGDAGVICKHKHHHPGKGHYKHHKHMDDRQVGRDKNKNMHTELMMKGLMHQNSKKNSGQNASLAVQQKSGSSVFNASANILFCILCMCFIF